MRFTDNLALPCPEPGDYGALALYMQRLAFEAEDRLLATQGFVTDFETQPTSIWRRAALSGPISSSGIIFLSFLASDNLFRNYGGPTQAFGDNPGAFPEPGVYEVGFSCNAVEVGGVTADSFRQFFFRIERLLPDGTREVVGDASKRVQAEGIAGGVFVSSSVTVVIGQDAESYVYSGEFSHTNVASDVQIPAGGLRAWLTKIGTVDLIEVV